jgi:methyl-accepting chemotaxis protein
MLAALAEQENNTAGISDALNEMNEVTSTVQIQSTEMQLKNKKVLGEIEHLQTSTQDMKDSFVEMSNKTIYMKDVSKDLSKITRNIKESIDGIGSQIDLFKV